MHILSKKILIIDPETDNGTQLKRTLLMHGYNSEVAPKLSEAIAIVNDSPIDLIILNALDLEQCQEACERLKSNPRSQHIPILLISFGKDMFKAIDLKADDYLQAPFGSQELFQRMDVLIYKSNSLTEQPYQILLELKRIIDQQSIVPYFQPIYNLKPLRLIGLEILSRPRSNGVLSDPETLFKTALRYGVYFDVEMIAWHQALHVISKELPSEYLFFNCDPYLLENQQFGRVKEIFDSYGTRTEHVFLEITERSAVRDSESFYKQLEQYRLDGFKIAIDDVGSGYSSLESIVEAHPEVVKLDRRIIHGLEGNPYKTSMVKLIVQFCRENGLVCIAEGIEHKSELEILIKLGVNAGQGYLFSPPTPQLNLKSMRNLTAV